VTTQVLIIDDAIHIRRLVARMLQLASFSTLEAADGLEGLHLLKTRRPDIVTCDISMPVMDGYQFLEAVRSDPAVAGTPIIIITAVGQDEETMQAKNLGADACLTKPFSSSHLLEVIEELVSRE
jgi:CheY-like chemotaxis protein